MQNIKNRKYATIGLFCISIAAFFILIARLGWVMLYGEVSDEDLTKNIQNLYTNSQNIQANRGSILDKDGNPIAVDATSYKMVAILTDKWSNPKKPIHIQKPVEVAEVLAKYLPISEDDIYTRLTQDASQVEFGTVGSQLSYHTVSQIKKELEEKELSGITFEESKTRLYPNGVFASHVIGLAQYPDPEEKKESDRLEGITGIEASLDDVLAGVNGYYQFEKDSQGYIIPDEPVKMKEPIDGKNVYSTYDRQLQIHLEKTLDEIDLKNHPENMVVTLMEAKTGNIVAGAQRPTFNAETRENIDESWQNLFVEAAYEPGSTFKLLTTAASVEEGSFSPDRYFQSGAIETEGGVIRDFNEVGWGMISHLEGLSKSSNVLFVTLVEEMGLDVWKKYLDGFGFGQLTGVKLPSEYEGSNPYESSLQKVNTAFGQGIAVTPIQMMQAFSAIANDGKMVRPRFVTKIVDPKTKEETILEPEYVQTPISAETAKLTRQYAKQATEMEGSLTHNYMRENESILAKTGTAEIADSETGKYLGNQYVFSVVTMFPAEDPQYILYITVRNPKLDEGDLFGGTVVENIARAMMDYLAEYQNANHEEGTEDQQYAATPNLLSKTVDEALDKIGENHPHALIGSGQTIVQQYPLPDTPLFDHQRILLMTEGAMTMPDVKGWSRNDILKISEITGIPFTFEGEGYAQSQSLEPGSFMEQDSAITIKLSPNYP
ncbi:penicillin-binding transpeptidase domain-containing protein [Allofustis seminis]|uniref:penicillin-binding transpeptidase domain-containing protein n=1 Tax=Allofustis seminis TaxID=166939 RepID=UPI000374BDCB|nr:penicillin-binding transpeptidase domain-containing protein [Allofustis seminis]